MSTFGGRLRRARDAKGLTQQDVGDLVGVTKATVSKWENNKSEPTLAQLAALREKLATSLDDLVPWGPDAPPALVAESTTSYDIELELTRAWTRMEAQMLLWFRATTPSKQKAVMELLRPERAATAADAE